MTPTYAEAAWEQALPVILFGITVRTPIDEMVLAGVLPAVVMVVFVCLYGMRVG